MMVVGGGNVKVEVVIDTSISEPRVVIHTNELTSEIDELIKQMNQTVKSKIIAYQGNDVILVDIQAIYLVESNNQAVFIHTGDHQYRVKQRLYEMEELLSKHDFIRVSNSEIVSFKYVEKLEMNLRGTIKVLFKNGKSSFASRRYVSKIKEYLDKWR